MIVYFRVKGGCWSLLYLKSLTIWRSGTWVLSNWSCKLRLYNLICANTSISAETDFVVIIKNLDSKNTDSLSFGGNSTSLCTRRRATPFRSCIDFCAQWMPFLYPTANCIGLGVLLMVNCTRYRWFYRSDFVHTVTIFLAYFWCMDSWWFFATSHARTCRWPVAENAWGSHTSPWDA